MANFTRVGYGQVEPNQLSGIKTGQIYASLPLAKEVKVLQNGEFMFYDYKSGTVTADGIGEPMLVYNEIKLYDDSWRTSLKDFAMIRVGDNYVTQDLATSRYNGSDVAAEVPAHTEYGYRMDGIAPRLVKTNVGDVMTTNMVVTNVEYAVGDILTPQKDFNSNTLVLTKVADLTAVETIGYVVAKVYTMPDGQPGLKLQRVK